MKTVEEDSIDNLPSAEREGVPIDAIAAFLLQPDCILDLTEVPESSVTSGNNALRMRFFNQQNVQPSRKQIGPILEGHFENPSILH